MQVKNIMSVDLEDYFCDLSFTEWEKYQSRIEKNTDLLLNLFKKYNVTATFFVVGFIAEKFPQLIKKIFEQGHEIASHSYSHIDLRKVTDEKFESDLIKSRDILQKITGERILGFRAPFFSIDKNSWHLLRIIQKYFLYDSSIFPVKTPLYGIYNAPRRIYRPSIENPLKVDKEGKLIEVPLATHRILGMLNIPVAGGFYLRFFPYQYIKYALHRLNNSNQPIVMYIHPKDLDPNMPRIKQYSWYYYYNLKSARKKFENILKEFEFITIKKFLKL